LQLKLSIIIVFILTFIHFAPAQTVVEQGIGNLTIVITGLENDDGEVLISVSNSRNNYESEDPAFVSAKAKIENGQAEYIFEAMPFGEYAIKLFHDENTDGELDSNFLGIPTEDYAFSNNASGTFGPAVYDDAKFIFEQSETTMQISVD
jgi:uncharacterized protein (DUF2141 family)